jgi:diacylglycerol kinase family enzyme
VFVGNNEYRPGLPPGRRARLDAGELFVCAATASRRHLLPLAARALRSLETPFVCFRAPEVTVELGKRRVWVAMDGEVRRLPTPLAYRIRPRALRVVAP